MKYDFLKHNIHRLSIDFLNITHLATIYILFFIF